MNQVRRASEQPPGQQQWPKLILRRTDQAVSAVFIAVSLVAIVGWCLFQSRLRSRLIDIEQAPPVAVDFKIDINAADWPELALLPGVGPQLGKRIVAHREANGPFRAIEDLDRVRGIGSLTLERIKPYLLPLPDLEGTAETGREPNGTLD
jgi:competence protein ComEA